MKQTTTKLISNLVSAKEQEAAVVAQQGKAYFDYQADLIEGAAEGEPESEIENVLGGLGLERTKQVVEERSLQGRCGNVLCGKPIKEDMRNYQFDDAVRFISNKEVVNARELDQYCSKECFLFFSRRVLPRRPAADIWELQKGLIERNEKKRNGTSAPAESTSAAPRGLVSQVKEKEVVAKPKKKFNTTPNPDDTIELARKLKKGVTLGEKKKSVTFNETVNVNEYSTEAAPENNDDENDRASDTEDDEEDDLTMDMFLDMKNKPDDKIETSGLGAFILAWDLLTRITTDHTREAIYGNQLKQWRASSAMEEGELDERRTELMDFLRNGIDACNFSASDEFMQHAQTQIARIVSTFDLSRGLPKFDLDPWALIACVMLGALAEAGRFPNFDFERNDIVQCFPSQDLTSLDHQQMEMLKDIFRKEKPAAAS